MQNMGMQTLTLENVTIRVGGGRVEVVHNKTGMIAESTPRQLDRWAVSQLRKCLSPAPQMQNPTTAATVTGLLTTTTEKE